MTTSKSQQFLSELALFYRNKGQHAVTTDTLVVRLNGKPVNLYELYTSVIELGGSYKVNFYSRWDDIYLKLFAPQPLGSNVSVALRQIYQKYLLPYEKANYSNFMSDNQDNDDDEGTNRDSNFNANLLFNHHPVNAQRQLVNQTNLNPLNKLFCSLMSDLPNEMDFGLRVATILTNSDKIENMADFKFVDVIIECCILYICSCDNSEYSKCTDYRFEEDEFLNFKNKDELEKLATILSNKSDDESNSNLSSEQKENICDKSLKSINQHNKSISNKFNVNNVRRFVPFKDCKCFIKFWCKMVQDEEMMKFIFDLNDEELSELYEESYVDQEEHQKNYYKMKRIASLLKNLSYSIEKIRNEQNSDLDELSRTVHNFNENASINLLRFLILLLHSNDQSLVNISLEIISNVSPLVNNNNMKNLVDQNTYVRLLIYVYDWCVDKCLNSFDVNCLNMCLEILTKLVNNNHVALNRLIISEVLDQTDYFKRLTELLTCQHDVSVVISALECTLSLSENYPKMLLNENKHLIKVLINLINCEEGLFFTTSSIKKVRITDERRIEYSPYQLIHQQQQQQQILQPQTQTIFIQNQPMATHKIIQINDNQALLADNEQHLKNWLHSNFESKPINAQSTAIRLKLNDIYTDYVKHSCLSGRRNVVTSVTFSNLLKKHFPSITFLNSTNEIDGLIRTSSSINKVNIVNSSNINLIQQPQYQQPQIQIINSTGSLQPNNLTSPILKAHLSTPPKSNSSNQISNPSIINSNNLQPQPLPNGSTASPLIKNLLATKLRNNQTTTVNSNLDDSKSIITTTNLLNQQTKNFTLVTNQHQGTNNVLFATNSNMQQQMNTTCITTSCTPTNLITVPIQQHLLNNQTSNSMIINTNQLNTVPVSTSTGQILLVRTILPQQNQQQNLIGTNQQPMRLILPASVLTSNQSQMPQTINVINGTNSLSQQSVHHNTNSIDNSKLLTRTTDSSNQLVKTVLGSPPLPSNTINSTEQRPISNNAKSSPLLNVLLDKGKLPDYSTIAPNISNDNAQDKTSNKQQIIVNNSQPSQLTNHIISSPSSTLVNNTSSPSNPTISSLSNQIVATSTVNSSSAKMYILTTTTKSPIAIKNSNSAIQTTNSTAPIQSFVIQQPNQTTINQTTNGTVGQPTTQFILQQNPTTLVSSQNTVMISQPLIIQQSPSTICTTIQNPKLDQNTNTLTNSNGDTATNNNEQTSKTTNTLSVKPVENCISNDVSMVNNLDKSKSNEVSNCLAKEIKKEIVMNGEVKDLESSTNKSEENKKEAPLTNGCLEKDKSEHMETDEQKETQKDSLLKRQLESNDIFAKRPKTDSSITIIPVSSPMTIKAETPVLVNNNSVKQTIAAVVVSSNGVLPNQPTISNTIIKTALSSIPKTNSSTCTIDKKITITKPNVLLNSNITNENQFKITPVIQQQIPAQQVAKELEFICEWSNCKRSFSQADKVFLHVHHDHINTSDFKATKCLWGGPDGTGPGCKSLRPKYSLLTHLQDFHCGVQQLTQVAQRNQQLSTKGITDIPPIVQPPEHPGYANNAASLAIKRRWTNIIENKPIPNISPLSKSVRLTSAMILRNLAQHSNKIKRILKNYESYLSELCMFDNREDSRTLAQCLAIISEEK